MHTPSNTALTRPNTASVPAPYREPRRFDREKTPAPLPQIPLRLPARLNAEQTAKVLGFSEHDIPVLVYYDYLKPLGNPNQSSVKYFATCEIEDNAKNPDWLDKATEAIGKNWKLKNSNRKAAGVVSATTRPRRLRVSQQAPIEIQTEVTTQELVIAER